MVSKLQKGKKNKKTEKRKTNLITPKKKLSSKSKRLNLNISSYIIEKPKLIIRNIYKLIIKAIKLIFSILIIPFKIFIKILSYLYLILKSFMYNLKILLIKVSLPMFFGFISGGISAAIVYTFIDYNKSTLKELKVDNTKENRLNNIENKIALITKNLNENNIIDQSALEEFLNSKLIIIESKVESIDGIAEEVKNINSKLVKIFSVQKNINLQVEKNSRLMTSASKSELTTRLHLASNLVNRLTSGVPYAPTLEALGPDASDPALLRFAKGGAPTLADLAARLSGRAGEVRDADKTKKVSDWENISNKFSDLITIRPIDIEELSGINGALLRAEMAVSNGKLNKAIKEIQTLDPQIRGPLAAWLSEAIARQSADIAANNILAKATAAIGNIN